MRHRFVLIAALLLGCVAASDSLAAKRHNPFWVSSDGKGTVSLFWLPAGGEWPQGGFRLERISRGRTVVLADRLGPAADAKAMTALEPREADEIRRLAGKIADGTLTDDERNLSISAMGRAAATNLFYGIALGVRYTDRGGKDAKRTYRLTALDRDGGTLSAMESDEVHPGKRTPPPARPAALTVKAQEGGVALYWKDPPAASFPPIVAYHVERIGRGRKPLPLTRVPLVLNRHLSRGQPDFLDTAPPRENLIYQVASLDVFGRRSPAVKTRISARDIPVADAPAPRPPPPRAPAAAGSVPAPATPPASAAAASVPAPATPPAPAAAASVPAPAAPAASRAIPPATTPRVIPPEAAPRAALPAPGPARTLARVEPPGPAPSPAAPAAPPTSPAVQANPPVPSPPTTMATTNPSAPRAEAGEEPPLTAVPETAPETPVSAPRDPDAPPPVPILVGIHGLDGKVILSLKPGPPEGRTHEFLVYRSATPGGPGVMVGRPIPASTRVWEDTSVDRGQFFWYRVVAVDLQGKRSLPTKPWWVRVGGP